MATISKAPLAVMTMVRGDTDILRRWLDYYRQYVPPECIFVLNHGYGEDVAALCADVNLIGLPYDEHKQSTNWRRWQVMALYASSLTPHFDWVLCNDVDEFVCVDPAVSDNLSDYLKTRLTESATPPEVLIPFAMEIVHVPSQEPQPIEPDIPILARRQCYRLNSNYAKPCLIRRPVAWMAGGHGSDCENFALDPHLYLFHLRFMDYDSGMARERAKRENWGWNSGEAVIEELSKRLPVAKTIAHPAFRQKMLKEKMKKGPYTLMGGGRPPENYQLPDRFATLF